jgi:hypothetical protein
LRGGEDCCAKSLESARLFSGKPNCARHGGAAWQIALTAPAADRTD